MHNGQIHLAVTGRVTDSFSSDIGHINDDKNRFSDQVCGLAGFELYSHLANAIGEQNEN
jgi:hypothetical protein